MESSETMLQKALESPRSPTRLQKQAPTALHLDSVPGTSFSEQPDAVSTAAIPLLSPLYVSPSLHSSVSGEGSEYRFPVGMESGSTEKNRSQPSMDCKEGCQYSAMPDHGEQMALLEKFQTKFVLVDHSQGRL